MNKTFQLFLKQYDKFEIHYLLCYLESLASSFSHTTTYHTTSACDLIIRIPDMIVGNLAYDILQFVMQYQSIFTYFTQIDLCLR